MDKEKKIRRTIDSLKAIYVIIIGLAMKDAIEAVARDHTQTIGIKIFLLLSFFAFAIPFFHGMNRHLDVYYVDSDEKNKPKNILLLIDFLAFFLEACFLFFFAIYLCEFWLGFKFLGLMIIVDFIWAIILSICLKENDSNKNPSNLTRWIVLDICTLVGGILFCFFIHRYKPDLFTSTMIICVLAIVRTIVDFIASWSFYFPND